MLRLRVLRALAEEAQEANEKEFSSFEGLSGRPGLLSPSPLGPNSPSNAATVLADLGALVDILHAGAVACRLGLMPSFGAGVCIWAHTPAA